MTTLSEIDRSGRISHGLLALIALLAVSSGALAGGTPQPLAPPAASQTPAPKPATPLIVTAPSQITEVFRAAPPATDPCHDTKNAPKNVHAGLGDDLSICIDGAGPVDATKYLLFLNGRPVTGLDDTTFDDSRRALIFHLHRNSGNAGTWAALLGAPTGYTVPVRVTLGVITSVGVTPQPTIFPSAPDKGLFKLTVIRTWKILLAALAVLIVGVLVWGSATRTTLLKDNLLPQVTPTQQPYSLGRWQMAFWFTLVFASFVFLYVLLWDPNTVTQQALTLMGISGATALAAIAVDAMKDTPVDAANAALRAIGLMTYDDVLRVRQEIATREASLKKTPAPANAKQLQLEIQDRELTLRTYERIIAPYRTEGLYRDLTTDYNGAALHRVQVFCWTLILGIVFLIGVYQDLAMPQFSATLLALLGISGAGYVGFKYPETQN